MQTKPRSIYEILQTKPRSIAN